MERTKVNSVINNTAKAPKNQGFLEKWFQSGHSFSSAARYDHFDNSPNLVYDIPLKNQRNHYTRFCSNCKWVLSIFLK